MKQPTFGILPDWRIQQLSSDKTFIWEKEDKTQTDESKHFIDESKHFIKRFTKITPPEDWYRRFGDKFQIKKLYEQEVGLRVLESEEAGIWVTAVNQVPMIHPYKEESVKEIDVGDGMLLKIPSHGQSSYGYDISLGRGFKIATKHQLLDSAGQPKVLDIVQDIESINSLCFYDSPDPDVLVLPPYGFAIGVSVEKLTLPRNVTGICMAKSTLARIGIDAKVTPLEAGWSGYITLEISNCTPNWLSIPAGIGIMQIIFYEGYECDTSYADRKGKYMDQSNIPTPAKL